ncbi:MAG: glycogen synthase [Flavobacteriales bacterium]
MDVLHVSAECFPIAKIGGLADVVGALPKFQNEVGVKSQVIMPFYDLSFTQKNEFETIHSFTIKLGSSSCDVQIKTLKSLDLGYELFLVDIPEHLFKPYVYSENDADRFLAFQIAALDWVQTWKKKPLTIHCHDHHTGLIPFMLSHSMKYAEMKEIPTVFTIHNAQYQGWMDHRKVTLIPAFPAEHFGLLEWDESINPLATAIKCAWRVTTVSETYMEELKLRANGLESLIKSEEQKCSGVLNGIDAEVWNPATDNQLVKNYSKTAFQAGKKANKKWLCEKFELDQRLPLVVFIGRLVHEKGADLFKEVIESALQRSKVSMLFLGSGNKEVEAQISSLNRQYVGAYSSYIGYDESLAHKMYAGADFLLMPSRVEPCGLNQMYSMRYGTIPIVSCVGGLKDTIVDVKKKGGYGFCIEEITVENISEAIHRASLFFKKKEKFKKTRHTLMRIDHSWNASAKKYIDLYNTLK